MSTPLEKILLKLESTPYKPPQTISDLISNSFILFEVIDEVINDNLKQ